MKGTLNPIRNIIFFNTTPTMRTRIGGLWGAVDDLCILTGTYFPGPEWRRMRSLVLRYGLLSFELTFMQNEGRDEELNV